MARELKSCQFHALSYAVYGRTYSLPSPHQEETVSFLFFVPEIILWRLAPMIIIIYFVKSQHDYYFDNHHQLLVRDSAHGSVPTIKVRLIHETMPPIKVTALQQKLKGSATSIKQ